MAKTSKRAGQTSGTASTQPPPPNVAENEPHLDFEEEEMDSETLRTTLSVLQDELANLRANQENAAETLVLQQREIECQRQELNERKAYMDHRQRDATAALEAAIQLAQGQVALASQPDQPPNAPPQRAPNPSPPLQPASPQRLEQLPAVQQDIPIQDPEQQPPSQAGRGNPQHQRQNRAGKPPQSPRRPMVDEPNPLSRGQRPSTNRRHNESGSTVRGPPRHNNARGPIDQRRPPSNAWEMPARGGNSVTNRSRYSRSQYRDGHDYHEVDSGRRNAGRGHEGRAGDRNPPPRENSPMSQNVGGQPRQHNIFDQMGASEQRRRDDDLRDVLNDRRERHDEYAPPASVAPAIPDVVQAQIDALNQAVQQLVGSRTSHIEYDQRRGTPFVQRIDVAETPNKFKMPVLLNFDGYGDPISHVNKFEIQMDMQKVSDDGHCKIFPATLSDTAQEWFFKFPPASIVSWEMFVKGFYGKFNAGCVHPTEANQLVKIRQKEGEPLKDYVQCFMRATARAKTLGDEGNMMALTAGVRRHSPLWNSLRKNGVKSTQEFLD
ncbi:uncharacterized protein LOC133805034 [Humulus lupulus]|uniref:uncharacterized protein LOC133805034 n=1 Tax=Humulus lupulus TaxID=3486 RepID=UPI002B41323E|nr:uncharacterized protein LOC133805034 [Humulus lupulus]